MTSPAIVWFRLDLRLADHPALGAAAARGSPVLPVFVWSPEEEAPWPPGAASRWWLHHSLCELEQRLRALGSRLIVRRGAALAVLRELIRETGARAVFWNRRHEPAVVERDARVEVALRESGCEVRTFNAALLHEPETIQTLDGGPFRVFTPFWRRCLAQPDPEPPAPAPKALRSPARWPQSLPLDAMELLPRHSWADGFRAIWQPGETGALKRLAEFVKNGLERYDETRDRPDLAGTSRLSPHLHFGEISPRQAWHAVRQAAERRGWPRARWRQSVFLTELGWREFAHHLLHHFPHTTDAPLREEFERFPWRQDAAALRAWQRGRTGYPIVDAGMRELWATGWMHNRVRMIVASFLVKDLRIRWQEGARWFWDTLVDADLANNTLGWQWSAGCGADAAPFFRIFNPVTQGMKFDPRGDYVRRYCPELAALPSPWIHQPDRAPADVLRRAGIEPGTSYPRPIIQHAIARQVALEAFANLRRTGARATRHGVRLRGPD
jgi:deoxyribodipyrimidine photo-lyase